MKNFNHCLIHRHFKLKYIVNLSSLILQNLIKFFKKPILVLSLMQIIALGCRGNKGKIESSVIKSSTVKSSNQWLLAQQNKVSGCSPSTSALGVALKIPLKNQAGDFRPFVLKFPEKGLSFYEAFAEAKKILAYGGYRLAGLVNAGFFGKGGEPLSYFKASFQRRKHTSGNAIPKRPCFVYDSSSRPSMQIVTLTDQLKAEYDQKDTVEVFCAGPRLLINGNIILRTDAREGAFDPNSRADGADPVAINGNVPRSGVCIDKQGDLIVLNYQGKQRRCGPNLDFFTKTMLEFGCKDAINLDGGGSAAFFGASPDGKTVNNVGVEDRVLPVWLAVGWR